MEEIKAQAIKCRFCGEMLDETRAFVVMLPEGSVVTTIGFDEVMNKRCITELSVARAWVEAKLYHRQLGLEDEWVASHGDKFREPHKALTPIEWTTLVWNLWKLYFIGQLQPLRSQGWELAEPLEEIDPHGVTGPSSGPTAA